MYACKLFIVFCLFVTLLIFMFFLCLIADKLMVLIVFLYRISVDFKLLTRDDTGQMQLACRGHSNDDIICRPANFTAEVLCVCVCACVCVCVCVRARVCVCSSHVRIVHASRKYLREWWRCVLTAI